MDPVKLSTNLFLKLGTKLLISDGFSFYSCFALLPVSEPRQGSLIVHPLSLENFPFNLSSHMLDTDVKQTSICRSFTPAMILFELIVTLPVAHGQL